MKIKFAGATSVQFINAETRTPFSDNVTGTYEDVFERLLAQQNRTLMPIVASMDTNTWEFMSKPEFFELDDKGHPDKTDYLKLKADEAAAAHSIRDAATLLTRNNPDPNTLRELIRQFSADPVVGKKLHDARAVIGTFKQQVKDRYEALSPEQKAVAQVFLEDRTELGDDDDLFRLALST